MKKFMGLLLVMALLIGTASMGLACDCPGTPMDSMTVLWDVDTVCAFQITQAPAKIFATACTPGEETFEYKYTATGCCERSIHAELVGELFGDYCCEGTCEGPDAVKLFLAMGQGYKRLLPDTCTEIAADIKRGCDLVRTGKVKITATPEACKHCDQSSTINFTIMGLGCNEPCGGEV